MQEEKLKEVIKRVMKEDSINRNCDKWLVINTLKELGFFIKINPDEIGEMPSFETITRIRREIQNRDGDLLATEEIKEKRDLEYERFVKRYCHKSPVDEYLENLGK